MDSGLIWTVIGSIAGVFAVWIATWQLRLGILDRKERRQESTILPPNSGEQVSVNDSAKLEEIFSRAVDQLTSSSTIARTGALRTLERLAQDYPRYRERVLATVCDCLRIPFTPPSELTSENEDPSVLETVGRTPDEISERTPGDLEELKVRLEAQQILTRNLCFQEIQPTGARISPVVQEQVAQAECPRRNQPSEHWVDMSLDLKGATLVDLDLSSCDLYAADFRGSEFFGVTRFVDAHIHGSAQFEAATFSGSADFTDAQFTGSAHFKKVHFNGTVSFAFAVFGSEALFREAEFSGQASFIGDSVNFTHTLFRGNAEFGQSIFDATAGFFYAKFNANAYFGGVDFKFRSAFDNCEFSKEAWFAVGNFRGQSRFVKCKFDGYAQFHKAQFFMQAEFDESEFSRNADYGGTTFSAGAYFDRVHFGGLTWFGSATFDKAANFRNAQFRGTIKFGESFLDEPEFASTSAPDFRGASARGDGGTGRLPYPWTVGDCPPGSTMAPLVPRWDKSPI